MNWEDPAVALPTSFLLGLVSRPYDKDNIRITRRDGHVIQGRFSGLCHLSRPPVEYEVSETSPNPSFIVIRSRVIVNHHFIMGKLIDSIQYPGDPANATRGLLWMIKVVQLRPTLMLPPVQYLELAERLGILTPDFETVFRYYLRE